MTPELLKAVVSGRLDLCLSDIDYLVSTVGIKLHRITREIGSGDKSRIKKAPENIRALVDELLEGIEKCAKKHRGEEESATKVELYDLVRNVLSLPLVCMPDVQIEGGGEATTFKNLVLLALYETVASICKSGATQIKFKLLQKKEKKIVIQITCNGSGFLDTDLNLARKLIRPIGGDIAVRDLCRTVSVIIRDLDLDKN